MQGPGGGNAGGGSGGVAEVEGRIVFAGGGDIGEEEGHAESGDGAARRLLLAVPDVALAVDVLAGIDRFDHSSSLSSSSA